MSTRTGLHQMPIIKNVYVRNTYLIQATKRNAPNTNKGYNEASHQRGTQGMEQLWHTFNGLGNESWYTLRPRHVSQGNISKCIRRRYRWKTTTVNIYLKTIVEESMIPRKLHMLFHVRDEFADTTNNNHPLRTNHSETELLSRLWLDIM